MAHILGPTLHGFFLRRFPNFLTVMFRPGPRANLRQLLLAKALAAQALAARKRFEFGTDLCRAPRFQPLFKIGRAHRAAFGNPVLPYGLAARLPHGLQEEFPVFGTTENVLAMVAPAPDVMNRAFILHSQLSGHSREPRLSPQLVNTQNRAPYGPDPTDHTK